jgi:glycerophosphoryl diester phosphodiesterase
MNLLALLMAGLLSSGNLPGTAIIAHRGASFDAPENTIAALRLGFEQGADAAECDVHLSQDGRIVVIHDADTARVAGSKLAVVTQTAAALQALDASQWGKWKGSAFAGQIPLLADALRVVPAGKRLFIELKVGAEILPELAAVIRASRLVPAQLPLITFDLETARAAKRLLPAHEVCWIIDHPKVGSGPAIDELISSAKAAGLDGLDLNHRFPIDAVFVQQVHAAGLKLYVWTVDDPVVARAQAAAGVDGLTTNRPGWLRRQLAIP